MIGFITGYWWRIIAVAVFSYLLGSLNFAIIFTRLIKHEDIRTLGSGNAGFTNVLRCVGVWPAIFTFACDFLKGIAAVALGMLIFNLQFESGVSLLSAEVMSHEYLMYGKFIAGLFCIIGHSYPAFHKFRGGKGVTTAAAVVLMLDWRIFALSLAIFLIVFFITKIVSISSIIGVFTIGVWTFVITYFYTYLPSLGSDGEYSLNYVIATTVLGFCIGFFIIIKHWENIGRLIRGEEKKITAKKD